MQFAYRNKFFYELAGVATNFSLLLSVLETIIWYTRKKQTAHTHLKLWLHLEILNSPTAIIYVE